MALVHGISLKVAWRGFQGVPGYYRRSGRQSQQLTNCKPLAELFPDLDPRRRIQPPPPPGGRLRHACRAQQAQGGEIHEEPRQVGGIAASQTSELQTLPVGGE